MVCALINTQRAILVIVDCFDKWMTLLNYDVRACRYLLTARTCLVSRNGMIELVVLGTNRWRVLQKEILCNSKRTQNDFLNRSSSPVWVYMGEVLCLRNTYVCWFYCAMHTFSKVCRPCTSRVNALELCAVSLSRIWCREQMESLNILFPSCYHILWLGFSKISPGWLTEILTAKANPAIFCLFGTRLINLENKNHCQSTGFSWSAPQSEIG